MMNYEAAEKMLREALVEMLLAGRYEANNGRNKREHGYRMEADADAKAAKAFAALRKLNGGNG